MKNILIFLSLSSCTILWGETSSLVTADQMTLIKCLQDLEPFENEVVAYTVSTPHLKNDEKAFTLEKSNALNYPEVERYAVVHSSGWETNGEKDPRLLTFLKEHTSHHSLSLASGQYIYNEAGINMRRITEEEREKLRDAVKKDLAKLIVFASKKVNPILHEEKTLELLDKNTINMTIKPAKK